MFELRGMLPLLASRMEVRTKIRSLAGGRSATLGDAQGRVLPDEVDGDHGKAPAGRA